MCLPFLAAAPAALAGSGAAAAGAATAGSALGTLGTVASVVGTGLSVYGAIQQGQAAKAAADAQAKIGEQQAKDAIERGKTEEAQVRRKYAALRGSQIAGFGASGIDVTSGSALDLLGDTATIGEFDALTTRTNSEREAWGYRANAQMAKMQGANAESASVFNAFGTALGGATTVSDRWYRMMNPRTAY